LICSKLNYCNFTYEKLDIDTFAKKVFKKKKLNDKPKI